MATEFYSTAQSATLSRRAAPWPEEKQRRSRVNWHELLPPGVARRQIAWERRQTVTAMLGAGMSRREVADLFGLSAARIFEMQRAHQIRVSRRSPAEAISEGGFV